MFANGIYKKPPRLLVEVFLCHGIFNIRYGRYFIILLEVHSTFSKAGPLVRQSFACNGGNKYMRNFLRKLLYNGGP
jgi:hypothetical protein